jgi:hypothetical protein
VPVGIDYVTNDPHAHAYPLRKTSLIKNKGRIEETETIESSQLS